MTLRVSPAHKIRARAWTLPRLARSHARNIISNRGWNPPFAASKAITRVAPSVGETGDGPSRIYDPVLGRFLQRDPVNQQRRITNRANGTTFGIYSTTIIAESLEAALLRSYHDTRNGYSAALIPNSMDPTGFIDIPPPPPPTPPPAVAPAPAPNLSPAEQAIQEAMEAQQAAAAEEAGAASTVGEATAGVGIEAVAPAAATAVGGYYLGSWIGRVTGYTQEVADSWYRYLYPDDPVPPPQTPQSPEPRSPQKKRLRWKCTVKARGCCPPDCGIFSGEGDTKAEAEKKAKAACYSAGCEVHTVQYNCQCGHVTCRVVKS